MAMIRNCSRCQDVTCILRAPSVAQQIAHGCSAFLQLRFSLVICPPCLSDERLDLAARHMDLLSATASIIAYCEPPHPYPYPMHIKQ